MPQRWFGTQLLPYPLRPVRRPFRVRYHSQGVGSPAPTHPRPHTPPLGEKETPMSLSHTDRETLRAGAEALAGALREGLESIARALKPEPPSRDPDEAWQLLQLLAGWVQAGETCSGAVAVETTDDTPPAGSFGMPRVGRSRLPPRCRCCWRVSGTAVRPSRAGGQHLLLPGLPGTPGDRGGPRAVRGLPACAGPLRGPGEAPPGGTGNPPHGLIFPQVRTPVSDKTPVSTGETP